MTEYVEPDWSPERRRIYDAVDTLQVFEIVETRERFRREKNFPMADKIRSDLLDIGILVDDKKEGPEWFWPERGLASNQCFVSHADGHTLQG